MEKESKSMFLVSRVTNMLVTFVFYKLMNSFILSCFSRKKRRFLYFG